MKKLNALLEASGRVTDKGVYDRLQRVRRDLTPLAAELQGIKLRAKYAKDSEGERVASDAEKMVDDVRHLIFETDGPSA